MVKRRLLPKKFYARDPKVVALNLLGKILVRRLGVHFLEGVIVETEAYYGIEDPASRAKNGMKKYNAPMWSKPGIAFIYNVHNNWMFNVVAHEPNSVGAVLVRAIEPLKGIVIMKTNRGISDINNLANGPGRLTKALKIGKELNCTDLTKSASPLFITVGKPVRRIGRSHRIGVKRDLDEKLRFYIKDNPFVSKRKAKHFS